MPTRGSKPGQWIAQGKIARKFNKPGEELNAQLKLQKPKDPMTSATATRGKRNDPSASIGFKAAMRKKRRHPQVTKEMADCLNLLTSTVGKPESEIKQLVRDFPLKDKLLQLVDHMIATGLGGWRQSGRHLVNETGHHASPENWELTIGGHLKPIGKQEPAGFDIDKLLVLRECCNE